MVVSLFVCVLMSQHLPWVGLCNLIVPFFFFEIGSPIK